MTRKAIRLIIIFSTISLSGLIITQTLWVIRAIYLAEEQHDHRVDIALEEVLRELKTHRNNIVKTDSTLMNQISRDAENFFDILDTTFLGKTIEKYVDYHNLHYKYYYAIIKTSNDSVLFASSEVMPGPGKVRIHKACLRSIWDKDYIYLGIYFPFKRTKIFSEMSTWLILSAVFLILMILTFYLTICSIIKQKKVAEIRDDFINNITHEFKTPISTISLASEVIMDPVKNMTEDKIKKYAGIIYEENKRMREQVDRVLQLALMEKWKKYDLKIKAVDMHELIKSNVDNLFIGHSDREVHITYDLRAETSVIQADPIHITNVIINLVNNAIKYSKGEPEIKITTKTENNFFILSVEDKGIGIQKNNLKHIFEKFYRVPTGNVHNVKGFGIGLYYIKTTVEAHKGHIKVVSEPEKGTRFDIFLPIDNL